MKNKISHEVDGMEYEDLPLKRPKFKQSKKAYRINVSVNKSAFKRRPRQPGIIKLYCAYLVAVILK